MRAHEYHQIVIGARHEWLNDVERCPITLRHINRLKRQKKRRAAEFARKQPLIAAMYGDADEQAEAQEAELAREEERHEIEMLKHELELLKDQIAVDIDAAEIDAEQKEQIAKGAMRAIRRKRKNIG